MGVVERRRPQKTASAYFGEPRKRGRDQGGRADSVRLPTGVGRWIPERCLVAGGRLFVLFLHSFSGP